MHGTGWVGRLSRIGGGQGAVAALAAICLVAIGAHALLIPAGHWTLDEFFQFARLERLGWAEVRSRILGWSPRPVSEVLIHLYAWSVAGADGPRLVTLLALCWAAVLAVLLAAARRAGLGVAVPLVLVAAVLLGAKPGEMWFWPAAALAYLPGFAGVAAVALHLAGGRRAPLLALAALLLAAGSVEMGTSFVLALSALQLARYGLPLPRPDEPSWVWVAAMLAALGLTAILVGNRVAQSGLEAMAPGAATIGDLRASLQAVLHVGWREMAGIVTAPGGVARLDQGLAVKTGLLLLFWALLSGDGGPRAWSRRLSCLAVAVAAVGAALASMVFAFRQFGTLCCERQATMRHALVIAALFAVAAALPRAAPEARWRSVVVAGGIVLVAGLFALRLPLIRADLALIRETRDAQAANWQSGRAGGDVLVFWPEPPTRLTNTPLDIAPGRYRREDRGMEPPAGLPPPVFALLHYFGKLELQVPPRQ